MIITNEGIIIRLAVSGISKLGRITSGVKLIDIDTEKDIRVSSACSTSFSTSEKSSVRSAPAISEAPKVSKDSPIRFWKKLEMSSEQRQLTKQTK